MIKEKVSLGNERVSQEMAGYNPFLLWPAHKTSFQLSLICFESQFFVFLWKVIQFKLIRAAGVMS